MVKVRTVKEWYCRFCQGTGTLEKTEEPPKICPYCGKDEIGKYHWDAPPIYIHKNKKK